MDMKIEIMIDGRLFIEIDLEDALGTSLTKQLGKVVDELLDERHRDGTVSEVIKRFSRHPVGLHKYRGI